MREPRMDATARAAAYIAKMGPAIQGQGGDKRTFRVACALRRDFALSEPEALNLLHHWNATCVPPWSERDLVNKLRSAAKNGSHALGAKLEARGRASPLFSADEALGRLFQALGDPLDAIATELLDAPWGAIEVATDPASLLRDRKGVLSWLLVEVDEALDRTRLKIPSVDRHATTLLVLGELLGAPQEPEAPEGESLADEIARVGFLPWFAKREVMVRGALNHGSERPRDADRLEALVTPAALDGCTREGAPGVDPVLAIWHAPPEDPEALYARRESLARLRESLSPTERRVLVAFDAPLAEAADEIGTTAAAVKTFRHRIRQRARDLGREPEDLGARRPPHARPRCIKEIDMAARILIDDQHLATLERAPRKPSGWTTLIRPMTADEADDLARGWAASAIRRRITTGLGIRAPGLDDRPDDPEPLSVHAAGRRLELEAA
jgi:hypothetical protein